MDILTQARTSGLLEQKLRVSETPFDICCPNQRSKLLGSSFDYDAGTRGCSEPFDHAIDQPFDLNNNPEDCGRTEYKQLDLDGIVR
jgi:hypothetical protein